MVPADVPLIQVRDLTVTYPQPVRRPPLRAVDDVSFTIQRGHTVGLVGESGSGKSTIGSALLGLVRSSAGRVILDGEDVTNAPRRERRRLARTMQVVFQDPYGSMNPARTVGETLGEALRYNLGLSAAQIRTRLESALGEVGLESVVLDRYPGQFSGGQRQRLAIARAVAMEPSFIVCDEAVSALDLSVQAQVLNLLGRLKDSRGLSYLFISHDLAVVRHISDDVVVLYAGRVVERGPAVRVGDTPAHPYTKALVAAAPVPDPDVQARQRARRRSEQVVPTTRTSGGCAYAPRCSFAVDRCWRERPELLEREAGAAVACHRYDEIARTGRQAS